MSDSTGNNDLVTLANESDLRDSRVMAINGATDREESALTAAKAARAEARKAALAIVTKDLAIETSAAAQALYTESRMATRDLGLTLGAQGSVPKAFIGKVATLAKKMV